jgi:hypothetical protein
MCLSTVTNLTKEIETTAYKVFIGTKKEPRFRIQTFRYSSIVPLNQWLVRQQSVPYITADDSQRYLSGFHCYRTLAGAVANASSYNSIFKVKVRDVVTIGKEGKWGVIVANEMFVPKNGRVKQ